MGILKDVQEGEVEMVWAHDDEKRRIMQEGGWWDRSTRGRLKKRWLDSVRADCIEKGCRGRN